MARNEIIIDASPATVYDALLDARNYPRFVAGAKQLRGVDKGWPRAGTRFHHKVGVGPLELADNTKLLEKTPNERVVLEVRVRPFGKGIVAFDLEPLARGSKTHVVMSEEFNQGPIAFVWSPVRNGAIKLRNTITLWRLRRLVTSAHDARTGRA